EDALDTITAVAAALPGRGTSVDIHHLGGAFSRVPARSTAFPNRTARFWMTINGNWQEPGEDAALTEFAERAEAAMSRLGERGEYVNFRAREYTGPLADLTRKVYGEETYRRLQQVKRHYDPGNLFRVNYNVTPRHRPRGVAQPWCSWPPSTSRARAEWANAPPARISAATQMASMICSSVAPAREASRVCPLMQYGHWVTWATATAISCFVLPGSAPSAKTALLNAAKAASASGASSFRRALTAGVAWG